LEVGRDLNVQGDFVPGAQTKTVQQADGDMVVINRRTGQSEGKTVQTAGRDMVAINRSTGTLDQEPKHKPGFCPACEGEVEADHAFCRHCGALLRHT
jgi:hypothetical protein